MIARFKQWLLSILWPIDYEYLQSSRETIENLHDENLKLHQRNQQLEDLLANRNVGAIKAQTLYVTEHALSRYRQRIGFNGSDDELKKMIYKLTIRHLATMDYLPDGQYSLNDKAAARVKDNTVCTIIPLKTKRAKRK